jgi:hypothetical protein
MPRSVKGVRYAPIFIGVDPGKAGGLAAIYPRDEGRSIRVIKMPVTDQDILEWLRSTVEGIECFAYLEKVSGYTGEGQPGSSAFKFGDNYGALRMALTACEVPFELITPQKWQKGLTIPPKKKAKKGRKTGGESKTQWKNRLKAKAQQLFPGVEVTLAVADALLIAEYCRRCRQ